MKIKRLGSRALALLLLLSVVAGILPMGWIPKVQAAGVTKAQIDAALKDLPELQPVNEEIGMPRAQEGCTEEELQAANEALKNISGKFYIVTAPAVGGKYYMFHPYLAGGGDSYPNTFPAAAVTLKDGVIYGADPSLAAELKWLGEDSNSIFPSVTQTRRSGITAYQIVFGDGRHLRLYNNGNGIRRNDSGSYNSVNLYCYYPNGTFALRHNGDNGYAVQINTTSSKYPHFTLADYTQETALRLYRVLEDRVNTEPLYDAIIEMKSYLSKASKFTDSSYEEFLDCMYRAIQMYRLYNGVPQPEDMDVEELSREAKRLAEELRSYAMETESYIDISLEAYDFRADGFMFEALYTFGAPYSLSGTSPTVTTPDGVPLSRPGTFGEGENYNDDYQYFIEGLIEDELVDGRIVYTEATVEYIATAIWVKEDFVKADSYYPDWNGVFLDFANALDRTDVTNYGSYSDTLDKTDTGEKGGTLLWEDVETAFDLAYYMLHGIWYKAEESEENKLETKTTRTGETVPMYYNTYIEEFSSLRLLATDTGSYSFTSEKGYAYNAAKGYIYNDFNTRRKGSPSFNIAANLGYESDDMFGIGQTGYREIIAGSSDFNGNKYFPNNNYYYVFHASSPFVYREEDNLYFYFKGDDDVYFFINGQLVCDLGGVHGSPSATRNLNQLVAAGELNLKDGDICTFDMFFADRHLQSINLTLETNIKMMDSTVETEKTQYNVATGEKLEDGAPVETGTMIGYNFAMTNRMELGITRLAFDDPALGVHMSEEGVILNGSCDPHELMVIYTTCDNDTGELHTGPLKEIEWSEFREILSEATFHPTTTVNPLEQGVYYVLLSTNEAEGQLLDLLSTGLPANTRIDIYGMKRQAESGLMTNTLNTNCYPLNLYGDEGEAITGTDSCSVFATALSDVQVKEPVSMVVDYGKALDINPTVLAGRIDYDPLTIELKLAGLRTIDANGATYSTAPSDLGCTAQRPRVQGDEGVFSLNGTNIRYTLDGLMEGTDRCYFLYSVEYRDHPGEIQWYVALELNLIPANIMYYEAESLAPNTIRYTEVSQKVAANPEWLVKTDSTINKTATALSRWSSTSTESQDGVILGEGQKLHSSNEFLFFPFDEDWEYSNPVYCGFNYSLSENWSHNGYRNTNVKVENGAYQGEFQLNEDKVKGYECWFQTTSQYEVLNYHPTENDCFKIRISPENIRSTVETGMIKIGLRYYYWNGTKITSSAEYRTYPVTDFDNKGYVTKEYDLQGTYDELAKKGTPITAIRLELRDTDDITPGADNNGKFSVDYMYIGPKEYSYLLDPGIVYMDFTNDDAAKMHYAVHDWYGGMNFDQSGDTDLVENYATNWSYNKDNTQNWQIDSRAGVLTMEQSVVGFNGKNSLWLQTSPRAQKEFPMTFDPSKVEVVQIRFKLHNLVPSNDLSLAENGASKEERKSPLPKLYLQYYYTASRGGEGPNDTANDLIKDAAQSSFYYDAETMDGRYITMTLYPGTTFKGQSKITAFRMSFRNLKSKSATELGKVTVDYLYVGDVEHLPDPATYGYDSSYENDTGLSDGSSLFAQGKGVKLESNLTDYTEISFDFKGTGFDLISRTGKQQGTIRVELWNKDTGTCEKKLTVNNKGELELYQIPVVSMQGLDYGNYQVKLWVNAKIENSSYEILNRGDEFYFDALRLYDPIEPGTNQTASDAYRIDSEEYRCIKEVRNVLLSAQTFGSMSTQTFGALFVDVKSTEGLPTATDADGKVVESNLKINNQYALTVETYNKVGPKNEVYLDPGQAIAFRMEIPSGITPIGIDIGAKTIAGQEARFVAATLAPTDKLSNAKTIGWRQDRIIKSATAMYYSVWAEGCEMFKENGNRYSYVVIYNCPTSDAPEGSRSHVLSITDIKVTYSKEVSNMPEDDVDDPEIKKATTGSQEQIQFLVDGYTTRAAQTLIRSCMEMPVEEKSLTLYHSLNLGSDIALNYIVPKTVLEGYEQFYLTCDLPQFEGVDLIGYKTVVLEPAERDGYYYFTLEGLTAVNMMDAVIARLYMEKDGNLYCSAEDSYSIAQYAYAQMNKADVSDGLKTLCANLLRYGALAQTYKGYRVETLADRSMTETQRALLTDLETVKFGGTNEVKKELADPAVQWAGKTLVLDSKVTVRYVVDVVDGVSPEELTLCVRYTDYSGAEKTVTLHGAESYGNRTGRYAFLFDSLLASELRTTLSATVYVGENRVSDTLLYSVDTYGANKTGSLGDLCKALMAYSDSAKEFFA